MSVRSTAGTLRAGFYQRKLQTQAGQMELNVPKLRRAKFETAIKRNAGFCLRLFLN